MESHLDTGATSIGIAGEGDCLLLSCLWHFPPLMDKRICRGRDEQEEYTRRRSGVWMPTVWEDFDVKALPTRSAFPEAQGLFLIFVS